MSLKKRTQEFVEYYFRIYRLPSQYRWRIFTTSNGGLKQYIAVYIGKEPKSVNAARKSGIVYPITACPGFRSSKNILDVCKLIYIDSLHDFVYPLMGNDWAFQEEMFNV